MSTPDPLIVIEFSGVEINFLIKVFLSELLWKMLIRLFLSLLKAYL